MNIAILGSTGSIGTNTISVCKNLKDVNLVGVTANKNGDTLLRQATQNSAQIAVLADSRSYEKFKNKFKKRGIQLLKGKAGISELISDRRVDIVVNGLSGFAGLRPSIEVLKEGKKLAIANKEAIVMGWHLIEKEIQYEGQLIPVDSEHSAVFQLLQGENIDRVKKIILTASGGSVYDRKDLDAVTPEECLAHPNWEMGEKITVDSATLMNKGLELIEAHKLFGIPFEKLGVYIHPQSIVHALVEYVDGTTSAHLSKPDMRIPIQYALTTPDRKGGTYPALTIDDMASLQFFKPDRGRFPAIDMAINSAMTGVASIITLCAADEVGIKSFIEGKIPFTGITKLIKKATLKVEDNDVSTLQNIEAIYKDALKKSKKIVEEMS